MKQSDIAALILIVVIVLFVSVFVGNALFGGEQSRNVEVEVVEPISADFPEPDRAIFNNQAVNPTQTINIGGSNNQNPFSGDR